MQRETGLGEKITVMNKTANEIVQFIFYRLIFYQHIK